MLKNVRIPHKLYAGFAAIILLVAALLLLAYDSLTRLTEANGWDRHTMEVLLEVNKVEKDTLEVRTHVRQYWYGGDSAELDTVKAIGVTLDGHLDHLKALTADNPAQQERIARLSGLLTDWRDTFVKPLMAKRTRSNLGSMTVDAASSEPLLSQGGRQMRDIRMELEAVSSDENRLLQERSTRTNALRDRLFWLLSIGGLTCITLAALIASLLAKSILKPLNNLTDVVNRVATGEQSARAVVLGHDELSHVTGEFNRMAQVMQDNQAREKAATDQLRGDVDTLLGVVSRAAAGDLTCRIHIQGDDAIGRLGMGLDKMFQDLRDMLTKVQRAGIQVTTSTTEIAASSRQQEATGIEQAQTSVEVLSTTKEISANANALVKTMEEAVQVTDETTAGAVDARNNLQRMDQTMQRMVSATDSINAKLSALSDKASNINKVLTTITKVADQTNLLSLNAAIEAEKAGEAGRGFSVVALEIRRLSDQTAVATWDIEQMLKEMHSAVSASVMGMDKFSEEIRRSVEEAAGVSEQLSQVIEQVQKLPPRIEAVLEGMQSQALGASQISETIMLLNESAQQTAESLTATSEAVQQLQHAAQDLQSSVSDFAVNS